MGRINLKKFRIDLGLKSKEIAEKTYISRQHYSNIETGKVDPSHEYLEEFQKVFNVDDKDMWGLFKKSE